MRRRFGTFFLVLLVPIALIVGMWLGGHPRTLPTALRDAFVGDSDAQIYEDVLDRIEDDFYKKVDRDKLSFKIEVKKKDGGGAEFVMEDTQMTAALIMLCRKRKIPLPMKSKKNLVNVGGQIAFMISMPSDGVVASVPIEYITGTVAEIKKGEAQPARAAAPPT